jgi:hypothetical protein
MSSLVPKCGWENKVLLSTWEGRYTDNALDIVYYIICNIDSLVQYSGVEMVPHGARSHWDYKWHHGHNSEMAHPGGGSLMDNILHFILHRQLNFYTTLKTLGAFEPCNGGLLIANLKCCLCVIWALSLSHHQDNMQYFIHQWVNPIHGLFVAIPIFSYWLRVDWSSENTYCARTNFLDQLTLLRQIWSYQPQDLSLMELKNSTLSSLASTMLLASQVPVPTPHAQYSDPMEVAVGRVRKRVIMCCDGWVATNNKLSVFV